MTKKLKNHIKMQDLPGSEVLVKNISKINALVIGDAILDVYIHGSVNRISPEAPVPIVHVNSKTYKLGGACNVAANIVSLVGRAKLLTVTANDHNGQKLQGLLKSSNISLACLRSDKYQTIKKSRVVCQGHQFLRLDDECSEFKADATQLRSLVKEHIGSADVVLLSDYGKGLLHDPGSLIRDIRSAGLKVFIDPKGKNYKKYKGATVITPNLSEFYEAIGRWHSEEELFNKAHELRRKLEIDAILLTRSSDGMTLFDVEGGNEKSFHINATKKEVFDVTGAGDTVVSVLALMCAAGFSMREAALFANKAAGLVVSNFGTAQIDIEDLIN